MNRHWMGPYEPGKWGVVSTINNGFPEWRGDAIWSEETARALAAKYDDIDRCSTILRTPGRRHYAVERGTTTQILIQFERIMRSR